MPKAIDISGRRFGKLVAKRCIGSGPGGRIWEFLCDCGRTCKAPASRAILGTTRSCGCGIVEAVILRCTKHGNAKMGCHTTEYRIWQGMRKRCLCTTEAAYPNYGGRGITICDQWESFPQFLSDMGRRPSPNHSLDRKNNDGPYSPENCRWATRTEQARNTRKNVYLSMEGVTMTLPEWAERIGVKPKSLYHRRKRGWSDERILTQRYRKSPIKK